MTTMSRQDIQHMATHMAWWHGRVLLPGTAGVAYRPGKTRRSQIENRAATMRHARD